MKEDLDPIIEWAVWGNLDSKADLELILLKGHLFLEAILEICLKKKGVSNCEELSFHKKIIEFDKICVNNDVEKTIVICALIEANKLRNKLAHELDFAINNGRLEAWAANIIKDLKGAKFTKYTFRTKIVHSFSILAKNIMEL